MWVKEATADNLMSTSLDIVRFISQKKCQKNLLWNVQLVPATVSLIPKVTVHVKGDKAEVIFAGPQRAHTRTGSCLYWRRVFDGSLIDKNIRMVKSCSTFRLTIQYNLLKIR